MTASNVENKLSESKNKLKEAAAIAGAAAKDIEQETKANAEEKLQQGQAKAEHALEQAQTFVKDKPLVTIGLAFAAGWLISRATK